MAGAHLLSPLMFSTPVVLVAAMAVRDSRTTLSADPTSSLCCASFAASSLKSVYNFSIVDASLRCHADDEGSRGHRLSPPPMVRTISLVAGIL